MDPRDAFISYVEEDAAFAGALGTELRGLGHSTWTYEDDGIPGESYLTQVHAAIAVCKVFILVATPQSVHAHQVIREVEQAHEQQKIIIPVRVKITHADFASANPILQMASGTAVSLSSDGADVVKIAQRVQMTIQRREVKAPASANTQTPALLGSAVIANVVSQAANAVQGPHKPDARPEPSTLAGSYLMRFRPVLRKAAWVFLVVGLYNLIALGGIAISHTPRLASVYNRVVGLSSGALGILWVSLAVMVVWSLFGRTTPAQRRIATVTTVVTTCVSVIQSGVFAVWGSQEASMHAGLALAAAAFCLVVFPIANWLRPA